MPALELTDGGLPQPGEVGEVALGEALLLPLLDEEADDGRPPLRDDGACPVGGEPVEGAVRPLGGVVARRAGAGGLAGRRVAGHRRNVVKKQPFSRR